MNIDQIRLLPETKPDTTRLSWSGIAFAIRRGAGEALGSSSRSLAIEHLEAAKAVLRGANRLVVQAAIDALQDADERTEISDLHIRRLGARKRLFDPRRPGFMVRGRADGKAALIYRFSELGTGRQIELRIGIWPDMPLAEGRRVWRNLRQQRLAGRTPVLPNKAGFLTVSGLSDLYLRDYAAKAKRARSVREDRRLIERHLLPKYGEMPVENFGHIEAEASLRPLLDRAAYREAEKVKAECRGKRIAEGRSGIDAMD